MLIKLLVKQPDLKLATITRTAKITVLLWWLISEDRGKQRSYAKEQFGLSSMS